MLTVLLVETCAGDVATCQHFHLNGTEELLGSAPKQCCTTLSSVVGDECTLARDVLVLICLLLSPNTVPTILQRMMFDSTGLQMV